MIRLRTMGASLLLFILSISSAQAQSVIAKGDKSAGVTITASASGEHVRFAAPSSVVQIRLEVYNSTGRKLFDNEIRGGNVLDWHLQDGQAEPLADGAYLCVVTVKSLSGKLTQKIGSVSVEKSTASLQAVAASPMTQPQIEAIGPVEENALLTMLEADQQPTTTVMAHDGEDGLITRGRGALSFRIGDFYSGTDREQMRLTEEGNVGIGISHPQVRLDVDGLIRTTRGIVFPDGTVQTTAALIGNPGQTPTINLPGQSEDQAKTTDKTGKHKKKVGPEFNVNEDLTINGNIIFTPPTPPLFTRDITMQNNNGGLRFFGAPTLTNSPAAAAIQFWGNNSPFPGQLYLDAGATNAGAVIIRTTGTGGTITERMRVSATGSVGIGTASPSAGIKLEVNGNTLMTFGSYDIQFGTPNSEGGLSLIKSATGSRADLRYDGSTLKLVAGAGGIPASTNGLAITATGNVGIGIDPPTTAKLHVLGGAGQPAVYGESNTSRGVWGKSTGGSYGVYGESVNGIGTQGVSTTSIGVGGLSVSSIAVSGTSTSGTGVYGESAAVNTAAQAGVYGKGTGSGGVGVTGEANVANAVGVLGVSASAGGFGLYARNTGGGFGIYSENNVAQNRDKGGLVKAMIFVNQDGTIARCYNGITGASTGNCGFSVTKTTVPGDYLIDFGFQVTDRFCSVTPRGSLGANVGATFLLGFSGGTPNQAIVDTFLTDVDYATAHADANFMIIIY